MLTCHWHNWKFDLRSGANIGGGDALRVYPTELRDGAVWVDLTDPPREQQATQALQRLDQAMDDYDLPRIAREVARLERAGGRVEAALVRALLRSSPRLRDGMTHAWAAAEVWLRLRDALDEPAERLVCATEALGYIAYDTLREAQWPFTEAREQWNAAEFLAAVEAQDEVRAAACLHGALDERVEPADFERTLVQAALAHYNDSGHSLIYLVHALALVRRLGAAAARALLPGWLRSLVRATREDLLPDFRGYRDALAGWPGSSGASADEAPDSGAWVGQTVGACLAATLRAAATHSPQRLHAALLAAAAEHLLRFDASHEQRHDNPVSANVGWLDCTHAITFAHAVRVACERFPELWPRGLLQLALFIGRNSPYIGRAAAAPGGDDESGFDRRCIARLLDHGLAAPIFAAHLLKTWAAARDEIALGVPEATARALRAAVERLFAAAIKQRHALRTARQALAHVEREA